MKNLFILLFALIALEGFAQSTGNKQQLFNASNTYTLARLQAATAVQDTVTDTGVGALYSKIQNGPGYVTVQVNVQKVSGTIAGTLVLSGSVDGNYYTALTTEETQTALATIALTNTTGTVAYFWRLRDSPFQYYKISTSGGTTCVYYMTGYILKHGLDH